MQINRLRLLGFKSFVEPTELLIEPGLTGIVGPNGCGKSNLLEALRWVMGETSHKSMRAAAMDDVIFSGTSGRPPRNLAEVTLFLDNRLRTAPAEFNDSEIIEIARRIEREAGSAYRINGRDVRARDVKILFEDAATGARSPALVRQGQIGEIVNAKPESRRRILEDAAGVAGLHSRRHDAELRLKAAETNLERLGDILGSLTSQIEALKRQARQARRYRDLSTDIRKAEAVAAHVAFSTAHSAVEQEETALGAALVRLGAAVESESALTRHEAELAGAMQGLREAEAIRAAVAARLKIEHENFEKEAERAAARQRELEARVAQLAADCEREAALVEEAAETLAGLDDVIALLVEEEEGAADAEQQAEARLAEVRAQEAAAAAHLAELTRSDYEEKARRRSLEASLGERRAQAARIERQLAGLEAQLRELQSSAPDAGALADRAETCEALAQAIEDAAVASAEADEHETEAAARVATAREAAQRTGLDLRGVETEFATLSAMLRPRNWDGLVPVLEQVTVAAGLEAALGAALSDDLDAPLSADAPMHWHGASVADTDPPLPAGVEPLADHVTAPAELARRLAQVGIVARADGAALQAQLQPGQRLVSRDGDLWRWDGFVATADAPTAAAERLAQKNRLAQLDERLEQVRRSAEAAAQAERAAQAGLGEAQQQARAARQAERDAGAALARAREALAGLERAQREAESRMAAVRDQRDQASEQLVEAHAAVLETQDELAGETAATGLEDAIYSAQRAVEEARSRVVAVSGEASGLQHARRMRSERLTASKSDRQRWTQRRDNAVKQVSSLQEREQAARAELQDIGDLPAQIEAQRHRLADEIVDAERQRSAASDQLATAETRLRQAQHDLRVAQGAVSTEREERARVEARLEAARNRRADEAHRIREGLGCEPDGCLALAELADDAPLPVLEDVERQLARLKAERERLGGVNLAADQELEALDSQFASLDKERTDVEEAIAKLRGAIQQLNREGKKRIDEAFQSVNAHFQALFATLFGGGEARLEMIEGDDPLEGGLEIIAKPPGKKPATLSLLSGGEQTLTALSMIFAVFLTNPSPICVLDEVDAPLDDANVDRFATMLEKICSDSGTRFLVITHHPMTMSRMHRLFGVTMAERGVSQLVSVDLKAAERILEDEPGRAAG